MTPRMLSQTGPAFGGFVFYVTFQIQNIGYVIGYEPGNDPGTGCSPTATSCRVPIAGSKDVNLTSFLLYLNAFAYATSGALVFFVAGAGDHMSECTYLLVKLNSFCSQSNLVGTTDYKREQYIFFLLLYGAFCLPAIALTDMNLSTFNALSGLYVAFNVIGFLVQVWGNIFVPYTMREMTDAELQSDATLHSFGAVAALAPAASTSEPITLEEEPHKASSRPERELRGVRMSVWGSNALNISSLLFSFVVLGLTWSSAMNAGLTMTTVAGVVCVVLTLVAWPMLPKPAGHPLPEDKTWLSLPFTTCEYDHALFVLASSHLLRIFVSLQSWICSAASFATRTLSASCWPTPSMSTPCSPLDPSRELYSIWQFVQACAKPPFTPWWDLQFRSLLGVHGSGCSRECG